MKRKDEIEDMARSYASHMTSDKDMQVAFADALRRGAEWADRTMINKACEWLEKNVAGIWDSPCNPDKIVEQFKEAMKGE